MNHEWLQNLKIGDEVYISRNFTHPEFAIISRTTNTQFMVSIGKYERRFWKENGKELGGDTWNRRYLIKPSPEIREEIEVAALKNKAQILKNKLSIPRTKIELTDFIEKLSSLVKGC